MNRDRGQKWVGRIRAYAYGILFLSAIFFSGCRAGQTPRQQSAEHRTSSSSGPASEMIDWAQLRDRDPLVRKRACAELRGANPETVAALIHLLGDPTTMSGMKRTLV